MRIGFFEFRYVPKNVKKETVYLAYDKWFKRYKIGVTTKTAENRASQINNAGGTEMVIINEFEGSRKNEKKLHSYLKKYRIKGEWYKADKNIEVLFDYFSGAVLTGYNILSPNSGINSYHIEVLKEVFTV